MTHLDLVKMAETWLVSSWRSAIVLTERGATYSDGIITATGEPVSGLEIADAIGFNWHNSALVECKVSREDFKADARKPWRRHPELGFGDFRFYAAPKGLLLPHELPEGWGLLEATDRGLRRKKHADQIQRSPAAIARDRKLLVGQLHRQTWRLQLLESRIEEETTGGNRWGQIGHDPQLCRACHRHARHLLGGVR